MSLFFTELLSNQIFLSAIAGWASAQIIKTIINFCFTKTFDPERLFGSGGMPSSHSATVCALATATAVHYSADSFEFAIAAIVAIIVMYDARGVRRETGTQAVVLNHFIEYFSKVDEHKFDFGTEKLKELVGHTPLQVAAGAVLGVVVACLMTLT
ncbi:divergent PAP2 family protein [bacterium C-53]|nr:divergent PAP2 family protein [Lachnospiraceae bacterium]NBI04379.1 divergent PAP2 family protein [Lachnospiraceae bacterium]RKJ08277.1 divergent PAP2 family protein [bacterium C-53]